MATEYTQALSRYTGNGVTTQWSIGFPYTNKNEVKVYLKVGDEDQVTLTENVDYSFVNDTTILFPESTSEYSVLTSSDVLAIMRTSSFSSDYVFDNQQRLYPAEVMNADDMEMRHLQELKRDVDRCAKILPTSSINPDTVAEAIDRIYDSIDNIDVNAENISSINTNAESVEDIITTATNIADVNTVAQNILPINNVSQNMIAINDVAQDLVEDHYIETAAENLDSIKAVSENIDNISAAGADVENIDAVVADLDNVDTVATNINSVNTVAESITNVNNVESNISKIVNVEDDLTNIDTVATNLSAISSVGENIVAIQNVDDNMDDVNTVATNIDDIKAAADLIPATESSYGVVKLASVNETTVGTESSKVVTPASLADRLPVPTTDNTALIFKEGTTQWGKASAENDGITIHENAQDKLEVLGMIDAVDSTQVRKTAYVTQEWYDEHFANHTLVEGVEYITPSQVSSNVKSFRNVSDIFLTMRLDEYLNGAVQCDGAEYDTRDYTGEKSIGVLLADNKVPYCSYAEYQAEITAHGVCGFIAWDGGYKFKVPTLQDVYIEASNTNVAEFGAESLPNIKGRTPYMFARDTVESSGVFLESEILSTKRTFPPTGTEFTAFRPVFNASLSSSTYQDEAKVKTDRIKYRAMIQLATQTTDEAIATMTQMRAELDSLKALPRIIQSVETATGGYNVYSNGYYEEWGNVNTNVETTITLSKIMKNTNYYASAIPNTSLNYSTSSETVTKGVVTAYVGIYNKTVNSIKFGGTNAIKKGVSWKVSGFLAVGQY